MQRGLVAILTITLSPLAGWTAGAWHAAATGTPHGSAAPSALNARPLPAPASSIPLHDPPAWPPIDLDDSGVVNERDIYGNDISPAIASYRRDAAGSLYEEHSPQTEVARLKAPVT